MVALGGPGEKWEQKSFDRVSAESDIKLYLAADRSYDHPGPPRISAATVVMPNNHILEAGLCTYCGKKVLHFGASESS